MEDGDEGLPIYKSKERNSSWTNDANPLMIDILLLTFTQLMHHPPLPTPTPHRQTPPREPVASSTFSSPSSSSSTTSSNPTDLATHRHRSHVFWKSHTGIWVRLVGVLRRGLTPWQQASESFFTTFHDHLDADIGEGDLHDALDRVFFGVGSGGVRLSPPPGVDTICETGVSTQYHALNDVHVVESVGSFLESSLSRDPGPTAGKIQGVVSWMLEERDGGRRGRVTEGGVVVGVEEIGDGPFFTFDPVLVSKRRNQTLIINTSSLVSTNNSTPNPTKPLLPTLFLHRLSNCTVHIVGPLRSLHISSCKGTTRITTGPIQSRLHIHRCQGDLSISGAASLVTLCVPSVPASYADSLEKLAVVNGDVGADGFESRVAVHVSTPLRPLVWAAVPETAPHVGEEDERYVPVQAVSFGPLDTWYDWLHEDLKEMRWDRSGKSDFWNAAVDVGRVLGRGGNKKGFLSVLPPSRYFPSLVPVQIGNSSNSNPNSLQDDSPFSLQNNSLSLEAIPITPPKEYFAWARACLDFVQNAKRTISLSSTLSNLPTRRHVPTAAEGHDLSVSQPENVRVTDMPLVPSVTASTDLADIGAVMRNTGDMKEGSGGTHENSMELRMKVQGQFVDWMNKTGRAMEMVSLMEAGKDIGAMIE
ncbi:hypothetical protein HDU97_008703 [Phlyctochytrium planicorne]|nr:hypothetical protein HDU97_008703 [Phlyctochytrium planicorne]